MIGHLYHRLPDDGGLAAFESTADTRSNWGPAIQHGSPPLALLTKAIEDLAALPVTTAAGGSVRLDQVADVRFTHAWGGPLGIARDWQPSVTWDPATRTGADADGLHGITAPARRA